MPPKKVKDDKTFGLKNKNKSSKVQRHVAEVEKQQSQAGRNKEAIAKAKLADDRKRAKEAEEKRKKMEAQLFKPVQVQKVPFGTDPKTVLCAYFKNGSCEKGNKCKFSHDLDVGRKAEKINLYEDARNDPKDTMDTWDDDKLREVVTENQKKQKNATDIVCKYFLQAVEEKKYGWFWICPNGGDTCMYRHALPPGFVLRKDKKKDDEAEEISLDQFIEVERHKLKPPLTPVTPETFAAWKKNRLDKKAAEAEAMEKAKVAQRAAGKLTGMTGKDLFDFGGEMFQDEEEEEEEEEWDISRMLARYRDDDELHDAAPLASNGAVTGAQTPATPAIAEENEDGVDETTEGVAKVAV